MLAHGEYIQIVIVIIQEIHYAFRTKAFIKKKIPALITEHQSLKA